MRRENLDLLTFYKTLVIYCLIITSKAREVQSSENGGILGKRALSTSTAAQTPVSTVTHSQPIFANLTNAPVGNTSRQITDADPNTDVYAALIEAFEKLGLVTPRQKTCYTVKKIIREVFSKSPRGSQRTLGIYLFVEESVLSVSDAADLPGNKDTKEAGNKDSDKEPGCKSAPEVVITGSNALQDSKKNSSMNDESSSVNSTGGLISAQAVDDDQSGLSRTQVMVISTCSAVIGTFFLVAAIMRIRNYVKRIREGRGVNVTVPPQRQFRTFSGGLRGSPLRGGQTRTSSLTGSSSPERQFSNMRNSKDSVLYNRQSGDKSSDPLISIVTIGDDKPVLVITSASSSNSPSSSGRGSQEEITINGRNKKMSDTDSGDEEGDDGKDTECRPLLSNVGNSQGITFPYMDSSSVTMESRQGFGSHIAPEKVNNEQTLPEIDGIVILNPNNTPFSDSPAGGEEALTAGGLTGLSQSDSSLNSTGNPSYAYGNQVEYVSERSDEEHSASIDDNACQTYTPQASYPIRQPFLPQMESFDSISPYFSFNPISDANTDVEEHKMIPIEELPPPAPELLMESSGAITPASGAITPDQVLFQNNPSRVSSLDNSDTPPIKSMAVSDSVISQTVPPVDPSSNYLPFNNLSVVDKNVLDGGTARPECEPRGVDAARRDLYDDRTTLL